jgi:hypothetical protein
VSDTVWIPVVPLPLQGWRTDRCTCGEKFRGKGRKAAYELHFRRVHLRNDLPDDWPQAGVPRVEAQRIYAEVNADSTAPPERERA